MHVPKIDNLKRQKNNFPFFFCTAGTRVHELLYEISRRIQLKVITFFVIKPMLPKIRRETS